MVKIKIFETNGHQEEVENQINSFLQSVKYIGINAHIMKFGSSLDIMILYESGNSQEQVKIYNLNFEHAEVEDIINEFLSDKTLKDLLYFENHQDGGWHTCIIVYK